MAANSEHNQPEQQELPDLNNPANRHESSDVDIKAISRFGIALVILCIATFGLLLGVFRYFQTRENAAQPPTKSGINVDARRLPPEPRLQPGPVTDLKAYRAAEEQILNNYAWVDPEKGVVRVPVDQAVDMLAKRGLPSRASQPASAAAGVTVPTESALGAVMQQPGGPLAGQLSAPPGAGAVSPQQSATREGAAESSKKQ